MSGRAGSAARAEPASKRVVSVRIQWIERGMATPSFRGDLAAFVGAGISGWTIRYRRAASAPRTLSGHNPLDFDRVPRNLWQSSPRCRNLRYNCQPGLA